MHLMADALARGESVLYMMPEIAMTSQLVARVRSVFGSRVTLYHSRLGERRRAEIYRRLLASGGGGCVLGVRSALFLPLPSFGLVIVDEEHDQSYKQAEPAPRYNARDCAVWMARRSGAKCLLASATPSIESYVNATGGKYGFVTLAERYGRRSACLVSQCPIRCGPSSGANVGSISIRRCSTGWLRLSVAADRSCFSRTGADLLRGWSVRSAAGWRIARASVTLTYHKLGDRMKCHLCGYSSALPAACPRCGTPAPGLMGFGTEKVEEEVASLFPTARILRLDRDTAASPARYERIVADFERGEADVLVGTQMVTKGFDFPKLGLVGILHADNLLNYPDFRDFGAGLPDDDAGGRAGAGAPMPAAKW